MKEGFAEISKRIESYEREMVETMRGMIAIKAISPLSGGSGEAARADFLEKVLKKWGFSTRRYDYNDETRTVRSNIVALLGENYRTLWIVAHIDTVSEGDLSLWKTDPFKLVVKDRRLYARGASDNGQEVIAGMFALRALKESGAKLKLNIGLALVANEELGSRYGIQSLLKENIFRKNDLYVVPDWGNSKGDKIEIAEKGMLWLKITVLGKQVHASNPQRGINAYKYSIKLLGQIDEMLHSKYSASNSIFEPERSTFEMTKHEKNVESVNIIPGIEISYIDCRVLPQYDLGQVLKDVQAVAAKKDFNDVQIRIEVFNRDDPTPATEENSEVVQMLKKALLDLRNIKAGVTGIGGATCAAFFREKRLPVAVWSTEEPVEHAPNEYALLDNIIGDAKVLAYMPI